VLWERSRRHSFNGTDDDDVNPLTLVGTLRSASK